MTKQTKTILIIGGAAVAAYLLLKPKTTTYQGLPVAYNPGYAPGSYPQTSNTAQTITAASAGLTSLNNIVKSWFGSGSTSPATVQNPSYTPPAINTNLSQPLQI